MAMRRIGLIVCILAFATMTAGAQTSPSSIVLSDLNKSPAFLRLNGNEEYLVVVFLSPECPLCQNYTSVLEKLAGSYRGKIALYGIIPGKSYSVAAVKKFRSDYHVTFDLLFDRHFQLCRLLKATTTPQVFLISRKNKVLYSGLIDNWAASPGVQRTIVTKHYLIDAIDASLQHLPVNPPTTKPVGCLINTY